MWKKNPVDLIMLGFFLTSGPGTLNTGLISLHDRLCALLENPIINRLTAFTSELSDNDM